MITSVMQSTKFETSAGCALFNDLKSKSGEFSARRFLKLTNERRLLLFRVFLRRIALLANLLVLGRFHAALVLACLARLLGVITATRLNTHGTDEKAKGRDQG